MPRQLLCAVALISVSLVGCGTTVPLAQQGRSSRGSGGLVDAGGAPTGTPTDGGSGAAPATSRTSSLDGTSPVGQGRGPSGSLGSAPTSSGAQAPSGSTDISGPLSPSVVKVGLQYSDNGGAALAAAGSSTSSVVDTKAIDKAIIAWVNAHGGVAGRPLVPSFTNVSATASSADQSAGSCTQWTQDDHVTVALPNSPFEDNAALRNCLGKAGVPALYFNLYASTTAQQFAQKPLWAENISSSLESYARTYVRGLAAQSYFTGGKVGVVYFDGPEFTATLKGTLLPELKAVGVTPETYATHISSSADLAAGSSAMQSAVLAFRAKGINRVLFFEPWVSYFAFLQSAQSQGYHPVYGMTSQESVQVALDLGLVPREQLAGARLVSWLSVVDVPLAKAILGPRQKLCVEILQKSGIGTSTDQTSYAGEMSICESILRLQDVYQGAPRRLTGSDFTRGLERLGTSAQFATLPRGSFGTDKHWGLSVYYDGKYDSACGCFTVGGPPRAMS